MSLQLTFKPNYASLLLFLPSPTLSEISFLFSYIYIVWAGAGKLNTPHTSDYIVCILFRIPWKECFNRSRQNKAAVIGVSHTGCESERKRESESARKEWTVQQKCRLAMHHFNDVLMQQQQQARASAHKISQLDFCCLCLFWLEKKKCARIQA